MEIDESVDCCKLPWLPCFSIDRDIDDGDEGIVCSSWSGEVVWFGLWDESIRFRVTNWGWSLVEWSLNSGMTDLTSWRGRNNVEK